MKLLQRRQERALTDSKRNAPETAQSRRLRLLFLVYLAVCGVIFAMHLADRALLVPYLGLSPFDDADSSALAVFESLLFSLALLAMTGLIFLGILAGEALRFLRGKKGATRVPVMFIIVYAIALPVLVDMILGFLDGGEVHNAMRLAPKGAALTLNAFVCFLAIPVIAVFLDRERTVVAFRDAQRRRRRD